MTLFLAKQSTSLIFISKLLITIIIQYEELDKSLFHSIRTDRELVNVKVSFIKLYGEPN